MLKKNYCINILLENATSYTERSRIHSLTEAEQAVVNDRMIGNLYNSALKKKNINFDNIPASKGDIQKVNGYDNMVACLEVLNGLARKFGMKIEELTVVENAVANIRANKNIFEKGFGLDVGFLISYYNALVYACIEATSLLISSYIDYVKTVNSIDFQMRRGKGIVGNLCIDNLRKFNDTIKDGSFVKFANGLMNNNRENFLGAASAGAAAASVVGAIGIGAVIVPIMRELIYWIYEGRVSLAEYLQHQADMLEMNEVRLKASSMNAQERNKIVAKQKNMIGRLEKMSDKINVDHQIADRTAIKKIKQDNKEWNLTNVSGNNDGFMFI